MTEGPRHNASQRVEGRQGRLLIWGTQMPTYFGHSLEGRDRGAQPLCGGHQVLHIHKPQRRPRGEDMSVHPVWGPMWKGRGTGAQQSWQRGGGRRGVTGFGNEAPAGGGRASDTPGRPPWEGAGVAHLSAPGTMDSGVTAYPRAYSKWILEIWSTT